MSTRFVFTYDRPIDPRVHSYQTACTSWRNADSAGSTALHAFEGKVWFESTIVGKPNTHGKTVYTFIDIHPVTPYKVPGRPHCAVYRVPEGA